MESREQENDEFFIFGQKNTEKIASILPTNIAQSIIITPDEYKFVLEEIKLIPNFVDSNIKRSLMTSTNQFIKFSYVPKCKDQDFAQMINEYDPQWLASLNSQLINVSATNPECDNIETFDSIGALSDINTVNRHSSIKNPILIKKLQELKYICYKWRKIKGDGNCFYRSIIFSYIENIILTNNVQDLMSLIYDMNIKFKNTYFQSILKVHNIESRNIIMCMILVYLAMINPSKNKDPIMMSYEIFLKCFNNINHFDYGLVLYIRFLYYDYIKKNETMLYTKDFCVLLGNLLPMEYETSEGKFLFEEFYKDFLMKLYKDAEKIVIYLTPYILDINLNILMFEEKSDLLQGLKFIHETQSGDYQNIITILYRKSHYDLAYNDLFVNKFNEYLSAFTMENDDISVLNKTEKHDTMSNGFNLLNQSLYTQKNKDEQSEIDLNQSYDASNNSLKQSRIIDPSAQSMHLEERIPLAKSIGLDQNKEKELPLNQSILSIDKKINQTKENNDLEGDHHVEIDGNMSNDARLIANNIKASKTLIKKSLTDLNINPINTESSESNTSNQVPNSTPLKHLTNPKAFGIGKPLLSPKSNVPRNNAVLLKLKEKAKANTSTQSCEISPSVKQNNNNNPSKLLKQINIPSKAKANHNKKQLKQPLLFKSSLPSIKEREEIVIQEQNIVKKTDNFNIEEVKTIVETKEKKEKPKIIFPKMIEEIPQQELESEQNAFSQRIGNTDITTIQKKFSKSNQRNFICKKCKKDYYTQLSDNQFNLCNDCLYNEFIEKLRIEYKAFIKDYSKYSLTFLEYINQKSIIINQVQTFPEEIINKLKIQKYQKKTDKEVLINIIEKRTCVICFFFSNDNFKKELSLPCKCTVCCSFCLLSFMQLMILKDNCEYVCFCNQVYDETKIDSMEKLLENNNLQVHIKGFKKRVIERTNCMMGCGKNQLENKGDQWEKIPLKYTNEDNKTIEHFICAQCKNKAKAMNELECSICKKLHIQSIEKDSLIPKNITLDTKDCIIF